MSFNPKKRSRPTAEVEKRDEDAEDSADDERDSEPAADDGVFSLIISYSETPFSRFVSNLTDGRSLRTSSAIAIKGKKQPPKVEPKKDKKAKLEAGSAKPRAPADSLENAADDAKADAEDQFAAAADEINAFDVSATVIFSCIYFSSPNFYRSNKKEMILFRTASDL